jgi:hypothetical protein
MDKENVVDTMEYYLAIKKNEIMSFTGKRLRKTYIHVFFYMENLD